MRDSEFSNTRRPCAERAIAMMSVDALRGSFAGPLRVWTAVGFVSLALVASAAASVQPGEAVRQLQRERAQRTHESTPASYAAIDADIAGRAKGMLADVDFAAVPASEARDWAALCTLAGENVEAKELLTRYLAKDLSAAERHAGEMDLMLACVKLDDGETIYRTLKAMRIRSEDAVSLGSYFGGTFHHYVFNARGAEACLEIADRIEPRLPGPPFSGDEERKGNGWARRQLAATRALYLAELGRRDEAVAVIDRALETLDDDVFRKNDLRGDRQRYLLVGREAPPVKVDRFLNDFPGFDAYRGKVLMLEFTAHWCHACHAALPALEKLYAEMHPRGLEIVSLTTYYGFFGADHAKTRDMPRDEEFSRMPAMLRDQGVAWPMVYTDRDTMKAFGVTGIPQIMVLDKQGRIRKIDLGFSEQKMARFKSEIDALMRE